MNARDTARKLEGIHNIESIKNILNISRQTAINYISELRRAGYVKTRYAYNHKRIYHISLMNKIGGESYYQIINSMSPIQLTESEVYKIYGRKPILEETLIYAIKTRKLRVILAALSLFKHINNWTLLSELARKNKVERKVGALYDLAKQTFKIRRMNKKYRETNLPKKVDKYAFIIHGFKSKDFIKIQDLWKIYIPFNKSDLTDYHIK